MNYVHGGMGESYRTVVLINALKVSLYVIEKTSSAKEDDHVLFIDLDYGLDLYYFIQQLRAIRECRKI